MRSARARGRSSSGAPRAIRWVRRILDPVGDLEWTRLLARTILVIHGRERDDGLIRIPGGCLIVVEGIDGCGKTTIAARVADHLSSQGRAVHWTRRPSDGPIGKEIRRALAGDSGAVNLHCRESAVALFAADLYDQASREILPMLEAGVIVVCDRWWASSVAYQGGSVASDVNFVMAVNRRAPVADLALFLRVDPDVAARRRAQRSGKVEAFDGSSEQRDSADAYQTMFSPCSHPISETVTILDGSQDEQCVAAAAVSVVEKFLDRFCKEVSVEILGGITFSSRGHAARAVSSITGLPEQSVRSELRRKFDFV